MKPGIGFHELRQACEISVLREDLERLAQEAGALRDSVESAVEQVRAKFAALGVEELSDAAVMANLLQVAVTTLLDIREQARRINLQTGPVSDDDRPSWTAAADAPRLRPTTAPATPPGAPPPAAAPRPEPAMPPPRPPVPPPERPADPPPRPPFASQPFAGRSPAAPRDGREPAAAIVPAAGSLLSRGAVADSVPQPPVPSAAPPSASWLTSADAPPPPPSRAAVARSNPAIPQVPGGVDWLGPAGR